MNQETAIDLIVRQEWLDTAADTIQPAVTDAVETDAVENYSGNIRSR